MIYFSVDLLRSLTRGKWLRSGLPPTVYTLCLFMSSDYQRFPDLSSGKRSAFVPSFLNRTSVRRGGPITESNRLRSVTRTPPLPKGSTQAKRLGIAARLPQRRIGTGIPERRGQRLRQWQTWLPHLVKFDFFDFDTEELLLTSGANDTRLKSLTEAVHEISFPSTSTLAEGYDKLWGMIL